VEYRVAVVTLPAVDAARRLVVEVHDTPSGAVRSGWDELVRASAAPVFYRSRYLSAYHDHPLADIDRFGYLMVRESGGRPLAALPVARYARPDPVGALRAVDPAIASRPALLSHVWHCYDSQVVGAVRRADVVAAVLHAMRTLAVRWGAAWFGLVNVARDGPTAAALSAAGLPGRHLVDRFVADLTGLADFDGYLRRLRPRARANLVRNRRRADEAGLTCATLPVDEADLDEIARLCARTAARFGNVGFYPPATFARFVTALGDCAHVLEVRHAGRLVAVGVCLTDEHRFHTWTCGVDYDVPGRASPYTLLFAESVALALRLRRPVLEGGRSNGVYKERHGLRVRHLDAHLAPVDAAPVG
jgi:CelD/BcsL family acetyltransferase involved in cellulose biosynthesis